MITRSPAERLDAAVDEVLAGEPLAPDPELRPLVEAAARLRAALTPMPAGARFEVRLADRLLRPGRLVGLAIVVGGLLGRALRHPERTLAAAGAGATALGAAVAISLLRRAKG